MKELFERNRLGSVALLLCSVVALSAPSLAQWEGDGKGPGPDDIPEGFMLYQGDILLPLDFWEQEGTFTGDIWLPQIAYEFDSNVTGANQTLMLAAMAVIESGANVVFVPHTGIALDFLHIQNSAFNNSAVGRQGGYQVLNILDWNVRYIMIHELMHAMGFWHEQSRTDRDAFIQINWANISQTVCGGSCDSNFQIEPSSQNWGPYDFDSVMHSSKSAYTSNGLDTITVLPPNGAWQDLIGQRDHLSEFDQLNLSYLYREDNWRFVLAGSGLGGFGSLYLPFGQFTLAYSAVPAGGKVIFLDAVGTTYSAVGVYTKAVTLEATLAPITLGS